MRKCPQCKEQDIKSETNCAGCRHNGDGYGTEEFKCGKCGWMTSFQYDDAAQTYYYETANWKRTTAPDPNKVPMHCNWLNGLGIWKCIHSSVTDNDEPPAAAPSPPPLAMTQSKRRASDISGWGVHTVAKALTGEGMPAHAVDIFKKEEVDGEVLFRQPPIITRSFMMDHPKWKLKEEEVDMFAPIFKKMTGKELT